MGNKVSILLLGMLFIASIWCCVIFQSLYTYINLFTVLLVAVVIFKNKDKNQTIFNVFVEIWLLIYNIVALIIHYVSQKDIFQNGDSFFWQYGLLFAVSFIGEIYFLCIYKSKTNHNQ